MRSGYIHILLYRRMTTGLIIVFQKPWFLRTRGRVDGRCRGCHVMMHIALILVMFEFVAMGVGYIDFMKIRSGLVIFLYM